MSTRTFLGAGLVALLLAGADAAAQYPSKPVTFVVPYPAGGPGDVMTRLVTIHLKDSLGQPLIVENRPGATGNIGTAAVIKAPADGHAILFNTSALAINPWLAQTPFDVHRDLIPVMRLAQTPYVLGVTKGLGISSFDEFVVHARSRPGKVNCSSYGVGSPPHLALELIKSTLGLDIVHVPYKGSPGALPDLVAGTLDCSIESPLRALEIHVKSGAVRILANTGNQRMTVYPDAEPIGKRYPGAVVVGWQAFFVRAGTPPAIVQRLNAEVARVLALPEVIDKVRASGFEPILGDTADKFAADFLEEHARYGRIIKERNIGLE